MLVMKIFKTAIDLERKQSCVTDPCATPTPDTSAGNGRFGTGGGKRQHAGNTGTSWVVAAVPVIISPKINVAGSAHNPTRRSNSCTGVPNGTNRF